MTEEITLRLEECNLTESEELKENIRLNLKPLEEIFKELNEHAITPMQYLQKVFKILFKNI